MKSSTLRRLLAVTVVSLALAAAPRAFTQEDPDEEEPVQAMPKEGVVSPSSRKGTPPPRLKTMPSVKATPIEIPGKSEPVIKTKPSVGATPIEIPGRGQPPPAQMKPLPSRDVLPVPLPGGRKPQPQQVQPLPSKGAVPVTKPGNQ